MPPMRRVPVFVLLLMLSGCGFSAPVAKRTPAPPMPEPPLSTVSATLTLPSDAIARELNRKTEEKIAEIHGQSIDCKITRCLVDLIATRTGSTVVTAGDGDVAVTMPFAIDAKIQAKALFMDLGASGQGSGIAHARAVLDVRPDWSVVAHTGGDIKLSDSRITVGSMRVDLTDMLNRNSAQLSRPMFRALDRDIPKFLRLRSQMERLWSEAFKPIRVANKPLAWLLLQPQSIRFASPVTANDALSVGLAIEGRPRVVVAGTPPESEPTALPRLLPLQTRGNVFRFTVPVSLPYDDAARLAMRALEKNPVRIGSGVTVRFERLAILPSGEDVVVETRFCVKQGWWDIFSWFDSCGTGYLRGTPLFDAKTETIRIIHVHFDVATESVVLTLAQAFEGDALGKELEKRLVFPVAREIARLHDGVRRALSRPQGRDVSITADVRHFGDPLLSWTATGFAALFTAEGEVHATLHLH
jgi:hypothetical protein